MFIYNHDVKHPEGTVLMYLKLSYLLCSTCTYYTNIFKVHFSVLWPHKITSTHTITHISHRIQFSKVRQFLSWNNAHSYIMLQYIQETSIIS